MTTIWEFIQQNIDSLGVIATVFSVIGGILVVWKWGRDILTWFWHLILRFKPKVPRETVRILPQLGGCRWSNGSVSGKPAMHVVGDWHVTNITGDPVSLLAARLAKPRIEGRVITRHPDENVFGRYPILPGKTTEVSSEFWIIPPCKKAGEDLKTSVFLTDQYRNDHKIKKVVFTGPRPEEPERKGPPIESMYATKDPIEKEVVAVLKAEVTRYKECGRRVGGLGSIQTKIIGQTYKGIGTEWREGDSPKNQTIIENEGDVEIISDNAQALLNLHSSLASDEEGERFFQALLKRVSKETEYAPVGYLVLYVMFQLGRLQDSLDKAKRDLQGDDAYGFSDLLRFLDGLLRFKHGDFSSEMLDNIESTIEGLDEHTFRISERLAAIRAFRLATEK